MSTYLRILCLLTIEGTTYAQPRISPQLALARICASEEGLERLTDGCAAIHRTLLHGAARRHMTYVEFALAHSSGVFDGDGRRPWLADLQPDGREPIGWPQVSMHRVHGQVIVHNGPSWLAYRQHWLDLYEHAGLLQQEVITDFCEEPPDTWGCPPDQHHQCRDHERAVRLGLIRVMCGDTRNEFWRLPDSQDR